MKELIVTGDSWTFGSEIINPDLPKDINELDESNDIYRISKIWPTLLKEKLNFNEIKNLGFPSASNDRAIRVLINYLTKKYISKNKSVDDLFVVVGLTSPERKDFYYKSDDISRWVTLWPAWEHKYNELGVNDLAKTYVTYFWNEEEFLNRYLNQLIYLQSFFKEYNIKYLIFQSFYQPQQEYHKIETWKDSPYINMWNDTFNGANDSLNKKYFEGSSERELWDMVDSIKFMNKTKDIHSFHGFLTQHGQWSNINHIDYNMLHPNEEGHKLWANELSTYIKNNNLHRKQ